MSTKDFLLLNQWLMAVGCVVLYLEQPFLGRPADNQFRFVDARLQGDVAILIFSCGLVIEVVDPSSMEFSTSCVDFESISVLRIKWRGKDVVLNGTSLRIEA